MPSIVRHTASTLCCTTSLTMTSFSHLVSHASTYAKDPYEYANLGKCKPCCSTVAVQLFIVFLHSLPFFLFSPPIHSTLCTYHKHRRIAVAVAGTKNRCNPDCPVGSLLVLAVAEVFASRLLRFILCALPSSLSGSDLFLYDPDLLQPNRCLPQPRDLGLSYAYSSFALCAALFTLIV